jgi:cyclohexanone monooxygenase
VRLIDVSATRGVERMTETGFVVGGVEYAVDCMIFASGFEVTSDLDRRWGIEVIEGRGGVSIYNHWLDGYKTLHGMMTCGFPNQFFTGFIQSALNASTTEQMSRHGYHIAYIIKEALARGAAIVEPSAEAQEAYVSHVRATAVDVATFQRECTPSYFNGEGAKIPRFYAGEPYGPGWYAFEKLLQDWRDKGDLEGLVLTKAAANSPAAESCEMV